MPFLLILTGSRVDDVVELNPAATLALGSAPDSHILLPDTDVAPVHGQVFPAEGSYWVQDLGYGYTQHNLEPLSRATLPLAENDVLIVGRTFLKFISEKPEPAVQDQSKLLAARDATIARFKQRASQRDADRRRRKREHDETRAQLESVRAELEALRAETASDDLASALATPVFEARVEVGQVEAQLRALRGRATELATALAMGHSGAHEAGDA